MGMSYYNWLVVSENGETVKVYTDDIETAIRIACDKTGDYQPVAVLKTVGFGKADDALVEDGE